VLPFLCAPLRGQPAAELLPLDIGDTDTVAVSDTTDTLEGADTTGLFGQPKAGPNKLKIIQRVYNYREQLGLALGMMAFVLVIFTTTQNWNPD